ncbi:MAG: zinc ribbon domain-containing protein [Anaerolineales bacterium]|nr:zinc ribbon domain-containing protein [Anaerolineales bacterium]
MPTYAYQCQSCGVQFERVQKFTDKPLTRCPECRKGRVHRVVQPAAIVFKGSGWYSTDSRSASGTKRAAKSDKGESGGAASSPGANDVKAEAKPAKTDTGGA